VQLGAPWIGSPPISSWFEGWDLRYIEALPENWHDVSSQRFSGLGGIQRNKRREGQSLLDLGTIKSRLSQHSPRRIEEEGTDRAAVAAVLVDAEGGCLDILLIKRAAKKEDPWSGQMAFPGGRRESGDANLLETARRETLEETGIPLQEAAVLGELDDIRPLGRGLPRIIVRPYVFFLRDRPNVVINEEVALHVWTSFSNLPNKSCSANIEIEGRVLGVPAYRVEGHIVWGLTERILKSFIDLCA